MKKIAVVFPKDSDAFFNKNSRATFGGATVQLYYIAKELSRRKDLGVFSIINDYHGIDFPDADAFNLAKTFRKTDNGFLKILKFHRSLQRIKPDILVQRGLSLFSCLLALYCRIYGICFVFMFAHDREVQGRYQKDDRHCSLFQVLLRFASLLIVQSEEQNKVFDKKFADKCRLVRSGTEIHALNSPSRDFILWVGRMDRWKRPEIFIALAKSNPDKKFLMISPPVPGNADYHDEILQSARSVKNLEIIEFVHFSKIDSYFERAHLFINTSTEEGFPNTFVQACKSGTPVLSLNVNPSGVLENMGYGYSCNNNVELLDARLKELMSDDMLRSQLGRNGFEAAKKQHDIRDTVNQLLGAVRSVCGKI